MHPPEEDQSPFRDLVRRVRRGDPDAAREVVERYGPHIRRVARFELRDRRLRRLVDSEDVWQSVAGAFFVRAAAGDFELDTPRDLLALLSAMARNRARRHAEREGAAKRDFRRVEHMDAVAGALKARDPTPASAAAHRELLSELLRRLSPEERRVAELRAEGLAWAEVARRTGGTAEAIRKRHERACERAARELGLGEAEDG
jgi:RNA polymerase sigma-70 factor (ECF subfamily)